MAKDDHWFKFFYKLILISCQGWKDDEFGAYVRLLINQFDRGSLPDDPSELSKLITSYKKNWPMLSKKFTLGEDGRLRNDFMDHIRKERNEKSVKFSEYGKTGGRPKKKPNESLTKAEAFKNESYRYSSLLSPSSQDEDRGPGKEEEKVELSDHGFFSNTLPKDRILTETQVGATVEFIRLKFKLDISPPEVIDQWEAFKIQQFGQRKWYNGFENLLEHFRNSLKTEIQKNGRAKENTGNRSNGNAGPSRGKSGGARNLLDQLRQEASP